MLCYFLILSAALCTSSANLCIRKNLDHGGMSNGCLVAFFAMSFLASCIINPIFASGIPFSITMLSLGMVAGALIASIMMLTSKALDTGPAGATFAFQNSASVVPSLTLALLFGSEYGFIMTPGLIIGLACVVTGLFWTAARQKTADRVSKKWYVYAVLLFLFQTLLLFLFHWRCLLMQPGLPSHVLIPFSCALNEEVWFMPGMFLAATLLQSLYFFTSHRRLLKRAEILWGMGAGALNGASTYSLLLASMIATSSVKGVAFPLFAAAVILLCSIWGRRLYGERISWLANALCIAGILIATLM